MPNNQPKPFISKPHKASESLPVRTITVDIPDTADVCERERLFEQAATTARRVEQAALEISQRRRTEPPKVRLVQIPQSVLDELARQNEPEEFVIGEELLEVSA